MLTKMQGHIFACINMDINHLHVWRIFMLLQMTAALNYFLFMGVDSAANNKIMTKLLFSVFISGLLVVETPHQAVS